MKIGILIDSLKVGGVEKVAINQVKHLCAINIDAYLLVLKRTESGQQDTFEFLDSTIPLIYLDDRLPKALKIDFKIPRFAFFSFYHVLYALLLPFVVRNREFDHIVSHGSYTSFTTLILRFFRNIPYSIFYWDPVNYIVTRVYSDKFPHALVKFLAFFGQMIDYILVRFAYYVLTGGKIHDDYFKSLYKKSKIRQIFPGIELGVPTNTKLGYVFLLTAWKAGKNPEYIIELSKKLPNVLFKIGGKWLDSKLLEDFRARLKSESVEDSFEILGYISEQRLQQYFAEANLLLTTNLEKGFGMPVMEAAANGTTFIVPKGSGVCEVFEDTVDGFFTDEKNTDQIVEKIKLLIDDADLASKMGRSAFNKIKDGYVWQVHAQKLARLLELEDA